VPDVTGLSALTIPGATVGPIAIGTTTRQRGEGRRPVGKRSSGDP
jgi:hypothetical protein